MIEINPSISVNNDKYKYTKLSSNCQNIHKIKSSYKLFTKDIPKT